MNNNNVNKKVDSQKHKSIDKILYNNYNNNNLNEIDSKNKLREKENFLNVNGKNIFYLFIQFTKIYSSHKAR